jgi:regulator of sirC expression with transglutaminase-like and TPR domain
MKPGKPMASLLREQPTASWWASRAGSGVQENVWVPASFPDSPELERLIAGDRNVQLARIALEIARDAYPELDVEVYLRRIQELVERIRVRCRPRAKPRDILGQINWVLFVEEEFRANHEDYYDHRNSYLNEVLDRRLGIPISLSVLYWAVAEQLGLSMAGANLPVHFMLRLDDGDRTWFVDPFHAGAVYTRDDCQRKLAEIAGRPVVLTESSVAPCSTQVVVTRMLRNLKAIYGNSKDLASLLPVQRRLTALNPHESAEQRDLAILCAQTDRLGEAIDPLEAYLDADPPAEEARELRALLESIRRQLARWN